MSVIRSDLGPWRERRRFWDDIGLNSREGREGVDLYNMPDDYGGKGFIADPSTFDPVLAEASYGWYCPDGGTILDPFAGGSVRGLIAGNRGYAYTGVDLSGSQVAANQKQSTEWAMRNLLTVPPRWVEGDSAKTLSSFPDASFDYVFTCPPYHSLERYSDHPNDLSAMPWARFEDAYRKIIGESVRCLTADRFATWVVGDVRDSAGRIRGLAPLTVAAHRAAGMHLYNDAVLLNVIGTAALRLPAQWRASRKMGRIHQYVLTFVKGDAKRATRMLPPFK
ncbi:methyltransferase domain-containing protein [Streptomyces sp. NBC_01506]|uniref:methyltransferase domain-containing protein n=1 Tax=Streptomyces sp. NBC_01506 TaxID=2903887 RepID=UPI00386AEC9D